MVTDHSELWRCISTSNTAQHSDHSFIKLKACKALQHCVTHRSGCGCVRPASHMFSNVRLRFPAGDTVCSCSSVQVWNFCLNLHLNPTQTQPFWNAAPDMCDPAPMRVSHTHMSCELDVERLTSNSHICELGLKGALINRLCDLFFLWIAVLVFGAATPCRKLVWPCCLKNKEMDLNRVKGYIYCTWFPRELKKRKRKCVLLVIILKKLTH